ncbi:hypothetical protein LRP30_33615 [Bradyrhizobium sp. C-145]|uniref:hypothetical protein n=1 Tax=Bradyrhizobium sp. C-145 TaxID=574727 RepID=UPI00201B8924|nr:hypothetical protein [Bradyrhizobium sp. C-145]UQR61712.1 hypothetical protein LRP30_33615 [Bradyrhizobium sp. C-145]
MKDLKQNSQKSGRKPNIVHPERELKNEDDGGEQPLVLIAWFVLVCLEELGWRV